MNQDNRPDPNRLLAAVQQDQARRRRGKLKIFLGMAPGVGKTYAMLSSARQLKEQGVNVVIGYVETHGRHETEALLTGLEAIPRRTVHYRGTTLEEMDIDIILSRRPELVLVDELAHTNAHGSRHLKRYLDVLELLAAGLDVWTTVNVQHFESRADSVHRITGIVVRETVPDSLLDLANEIELVDVSPDELRKRLAEGKVYVPQTIKTAADSFFRVGNLTALREMALRLTAEHVDQRLQEYMQIEHIAGPWKSGERLMVAVGPSPFSERLIRWTRRMAYNLNAPWLAAYIETSAPLTPEAKDRLSSSVALARNLGGEVVHAAGDDIALALLQVARQRNVTQIVMGKPKRTRLQTLVGGASIVDKVIDDSGDIDVYVITGDETISNRRPARPVSPQPQPSRTTSQYVRAFVVVGLVTAADLWLFERLPWFGHQAVALTQLLAVLLIAARLERAPALLAAAVSAVTWNFLFIDPRLTFKISRFEDMALFLLYFALAVLTSSQTALIHTKERQARYHAERTTALYSLAHDTTNALSMDGVLQTAVEQLSRVFDVDVAIMLPRDGTLSRQVHRSSTLSVDEREYAVAQWAFEHGKPAGRSTATLSSAFAQYHPLVTATRVVAVVGIRTSRDSHPSFDQEVLLETFLGQLALAVEREVLRESMEQATMLRESGRLYTTLFNSLSDELRTPIAAIRGAARALGNTVADADGQSRLELTRDIQASVDRLGRLVDNLLDMSRLESGRQHLDRDWCVAGEIVAAAVERIAHCADVHPTEIRVEPDLPLVRVDRALIEQALVNLLDNACEHTPPGTRITVEARALDGLVELTVADAGPGIDDDLLERIFHKFYRVPGSAPGGAGLGLSVSRGLVEAHGGTLTAEKPTGGGTKFVMRLRVESA